MAAKLKPRALLSDRSRWEHVVLQQARDVDQYDDCGYERALLELYGTVTRGSTTAQAPYLRSPRD